jgi:hypothetical protein
MELKEGSTYIIRDNTFPRRSYYKIKVHEITETSILWENLDLNNNHRVREGLEYFKRNHTILEQLDSLENYFAQVTYIYTPKTVFIETPYEAI